MLTILFNINYWFYVFVSVWIPWDSCFLPTRHITSTHYSHNLAPPTTQSDNFLWITTTSFCCNARSSRSNSSTCCRITRCCRNTRCCCNTRCCNNFYRSNITPVQAVPCWRQVPTLQQQQSPSSSTWTNMKVNVAATLGQKISSVWAYFTKLHRWFRRWEEPGQERHAACVAETARSVSPAHPQWWQGFDLTFAKGINSITHPRRIARNAPYERTR